MTEPLRLATPAGGRLLQYRPADLFIRFNTSGGWRGRRTVRPGLCGGVGRRRLPGEPARTSAPRAVGGVRSSSPCGCRGPTTRCRSPQRSRRPPALPRWGFNHSQSDPLCFPSSRERCSGAQLEWQKNDAWVPSIFDCATRQESRRPDNERTDMSRNDRPNFFVVVLDCDLHSMTNNWVI